VRAIPYFAYGSNLSKRDMARRAPDAVEGGTARLPGWKLTFRGVADVVPAEGRAVEGAIWWISAKDMLELDRYEGVPSFYERRYLEVEKADGSKQKALVYVMTPDDGWGHRPGLPSPGYFSTVAEGFYEWDLPLAALSVAVEETRDAHEAEGVVSYVPDGPKRMRAEIPGARNWKPRETKRERKRRRRAERAKKQRSASRRATQPAEVVWDDGSPVWAGARSDGSYDDFWEGMTPATRREWALEMGLSEEEVGLGPESDLIEGIVSGERLA